MRKAISIKEAFEITITLFKEQQSELERYKIFAREAIKNNVAIRQNNYKKDVSFVDVSKEVLNLAAEFGNTSLYQEIEKDLK